MDDLPFLDDIEDYNTSINSVDVRREKNTNYALNGVLNFLNKYGCNIAINFISADRLHTRFLSESYHRKYHPTRGIDPIIEAQRHTANIYRKIKDKYVVLQTEVKDRLPKQYLSINKPTMDFKEFKQHWIQYVTDIKKYYEIGLLDSAETILETNELEKAYEEKGAFLTVYLQAFEKTLKPLAENYDRLKLFTEIFNKRNAVTHKEIKYDKYGVSVFIDGERLPLKCLSSGEKNDFIMFYNLIFNSWDKSLVLIDEPEISLHIEWQEEYLDCLLEICKVNGLQAIVATHSPNIVNGHFELFAERGLQDER